LRNILLISIYSKGILNIFGFSPDDRIERRELVLMYRAVESDMEAEISRLALSGQYDKAKELRQRLTNIRLEFDDLQSNGAKVIRNDQIKIFEKASTKFLDDLNSSVKSSVEQVNEECDKLLKDQKLAHEIQRENLEKQISRIPRPRMKYSKRASMCTQRYHDPLFNQ
jgi:gas vesicle protein